MKAEDKALELIHKFIKVLPPEEAQFEVIIAKQCAIYAVDEVMWAFSKLGKGSKFYENVKQELLKL